MIDIMDGLLFLEENLNIESNEDRQRDLYYQVKTEFHHIYVTLMDHCRDFLLLTQMWRIRYFVYIETAPIRPNIFACQRNCVLCQTYFRSLHSAQRFTTRVTAIRFDVWLGAYLIFSRSKRWKERERMCSFVAGKIRDFPILQLF